MVTLVLDLSEDFQSRVSKGIVLDALSELQEVKTPLGCCQVRKPYIRKSMFTVYQNLYASAKQPHPRAVANAVGVYYLDVFQEL